MMLVGRALFASPSNGCIDRRSDKSDAAAVDVGRASKPPQMPLSAGAGGVEVALVVALASSIGATLSAAGIGIGSRAPPHAKSATETPSIIDSNRNIWRILVHDHALDGSPVIVGDRPFAALEAKKISGRK
jgi:hypothetical protein